MGKDPQVSRESSAEWIIPAWLKWKMNQLGSPTLACSCITSAHCISSSALAAAAVLCSCCTLCSPALDFPACKQHSISLSAELRGLLAMQAVRTATICPLSSRSLPDCCHLCSVSPLKGLEPAEAFFQIYSDCSEP